MGMSPETQKRSNYVEDFDFRVFFLAFLALPLRRFEGDFVRLISSNNPAIPQTVDCPLLANIIGIEEAFSDRDNADTNSF